MLCLLTQIWDLDVKESEPKIKQFYQIDSGLWRVFEEAVIREILKEKSKIFLFIANDKVKVIRSVRLRADDML